MREKAQKIIDADGRFIPGEYLYRGYKIINRNGDGWCVYPINEDGTGSTQEVACTTLLCLAKTAVDKLVGN